MNWNTSRGTDPLPRTREFVATLDDVMAALDENGIGEREKEEVLFMLYGMKAEVVHI